ncbi:MAG: alpha/beta hydrolase [Chitinophagaceae bacterium]
MKLQFISVLVFLSFWANAQNGESIIIGKKENIQSNVLNENRTLWIYTPNNTSQNASTEKRYPVLYVLDGNAHFFSTVGIIQQFSQANGNGVLPEMIVVGIENTNRLRDLVPSSDVAKPNPFVNFLSSELIPYIDKNYNTAPYRLLVGHSLGGLTAIDMLTNFPALFNACIAIDPSMWYDNEKFLKNTIAQLPKQTMNGKKLFVGTANTLPGGMTVSQLKNDNSPETQHIRSIFKLNDFLKANKNGLLYSHKYYQAERHNTVPLLSEYDGLRFIFDYYFFDANEKDFMDSTALIASKLKKHYAKVSGEMGYKNAAPEALINYLAYDALGKNHNTKSKELFELNREWYPESSKVYDSYADYYLAKKDTINTIENYKKALLIKNDTIILKKLEAVTNQKQPGISINDLQKYAGIYTLVDFQLDIALVVRGGKLLAVMPGQADDEFQLLSENVFTVKGKQGYTITFELSGDKVISFTSVQPNGTYKATFKNK